MDRAIQDFETPLAYVLRIRGISIEALAQRVEGTADLVGLVVAGKWLPNPALAARIVDTLNEGSTCPLTERDFWGAEPTPSAPRPHNGGAKRPDLEAIPAHFETPFMYILSKRGISMADLARRVGVNHTSISRQARGLNNPGRGLALSIVDALNAMSGDDEALITLEDLWEPASLQSRAHIPLERGAWSKGR